MAGYVAEPGVAEPAHFEPGLVGTPPSFFPSLALGLKAEIQLAGTWTDITPYLDHDQADSQSHPAAVSITRGRQDELATSPTPQEAVLKVWNGDGRFCSKNPVGAYYPNLTRNTPLRISYPGTTGTVSTFMSLASDNVAYASAPDTASLDITGPIDLRIDLIPEAYLTPLQVAAAGGDGAVLIGKWSQVAASKAWAFVLNSTGQLGFWWNTSGVSHNLVSGSGATIPLGQRIGLRVVFTPATGVAQFYTAPNMGGPWTLISTQTFGATSLQAGTGDPVGVGFTPRFGSLVAQVFEAQIYNNTTLVADPIFSSQTAGATSFTDAQSNAWTVNSPASIVTTGSSSRNYRFYGQISSLPVTWDPTGNDVWAQITASGILRRLQQGNQPPVFSTMRRYLTSLPAAQVPQAYWHCEDGQGSSVFGSGLAGGLPMQITGSPNLASNSSFACSNSLPVINSSTWIGPVAPYTATSLIEGRFLMFVPAGTTTPNNAVLLQVNITGGTCGYIQVTYQTAGSGGVTLQGFTSGGASVFTTASIGGSPNINGSPVMISFAIGLLDGSVGQNLSVLELNGNLTVATTSVAMTAGAAAQVIVDPGKNIPDVALGHIAIQSADTDVELLAYPMNAWLGEPAGVRFARLCQENGIASRVDGVQGFTVPMGYQVPDTLMNLLQACEDTDRGQIYDARDFLGLAYRTCDSLESQPVAVTLDYNQDHMTPPLTPTDDDLYIVNDVTVENATNSSSFGGSSAVAQLNDGSVMSIGVIGDYSNSYNVSAQSDQILPDIAGWILHTGVNNDERYPSVIVNLASSQPQVQAIASAVEALDIGAYAQIVNTPSFLPPGPVNLLVWGYTEMLGDFCNEITFNTIPEPPYEVAVADDAVHGRADTPGSALVQAVSGSVTTLQVGTINGEAWTTSGGNLPLDIGFGGERVTVTAIGAPAALSVFSDDFEAGVSGWIPNSCTFAQSGAQHHTGSFSGLMTPISSPSFMWVTDNTHVPVVPLVNYQAAGWLFSTGTPLCYMQIQFFDANNNFLGQALGTATALVASTWTLMTTPPFAAPVGASYCQMLFVSQAPGLSTVFVDGATINATAQQFTVTRSVNGIVKGHSAGEAVSLWTPPIAALAQ